MDDKISKYMRSFMYKDSYGSHYKIGLTYSEQEDKVIMLIGLSRIDDFLGSHFQEIATCIYYKYLKQKGFEPEDIIWSQCYPGHQGFKDSYEWVLLDWYLDKYVMFYRKPMTKEEIENFKSSLISLY